MSDLTVTAKITRALVEGGPLADLDFEVDGAYRLVRAGLEPGMVTWRRQRVQSAVIAGAAQVGAVKDIKQGRCAVRVLAPSMALLWSRQATLIAAFEQFAYTLTFTIDGQVLSYACDCADYSPGESGVLDEFGLRSYQQVVTFLWPHHPVPLAGPY
jgi:hypothetical protein